MPSLGFTGYVFHRFQNNSIDALSFEMGRDQIPDGSRNPLELRDPIIMICAWILETFDRENYIGAAWRTSVERRCVFVIMLEIVVPLPGHGFHDFVVRSESMHIPIGRFGDEIETKIFRENLDGVVAEIEGVITALMMVLFQNPFGLRIGRQTLTPRGNTPG